MRYILELKRNLLSLGALEDKGCSINCKGGLMTIERNSRILMQGKRKNNLYYLKAEVQSESVNQTEETKLITWKRFSSLA